jgi:hypothetical protein
MICCAVLLLVPVPTVYLYMVKHRLWDRYRHALTSVLRPREFCKVVAFGKRVARTRKVA